MDGRRFDSWSRAIAGRRTRRAALRSTGAGLAALLGGVSGGRIAASQEATPIESERHPTFLFVQTATGGGFSPNPEAGTPVVDGEPVPGGGADYLLTLEGHHGATIYFSDRPDRIFGDSPTQQFLDGLGFSPVNPPNAALVTQVDDDNADEVIILELVNPWFDDASGTLTYGANVLGEYAGEPLTQITAERETDLLPASFGRASLFIDECPTFDGCFLPEARGPGTYVGPIPGAPFYMCYSPTLNACYVCGGGPQGGNLRAACNAAYPQCNNRCVEGRYR